MSLTDRVSMEMKIGCLNSASNRLICHVNFDRDQEAGSNRENENGLH